MGRLVEFEEALQFLAGKVDLKVFSDLELSLLQECWKGFSYQEIAQAHRYNPDYVRAVAGKLWKRMSTALACKVTKGNFKAVVTLQACGTAGRLPETRGENEGRVPSVHGFWDCDEVIDDAEFLGRRDELEQIGAWLEDPSCRIICITGMGGIGKTTLAWKAARQFDKDFDCIVWRSLRDAPPLNELLEGIVAFVSEYREYQLPEGTGEAIQRLMHHLKFRKCLLVLDNYDAVSVGGNSPRLWEEEYEALLRAILEETHAGTTIITTRKPLPGLATDSGDRNEVLQLAGLDSGAGKDILRNGRLQGTDGQLERLHRFYWGNPLFLKIAAASIAEVFAGDVGAFLKQETGLFLKVAALLDGQLAALEPLERALLTQLAINRTPLAFAELRRKIYPSPPAARVLQAMERLLSRMLVEKTETGLTLQSVVMEHVTARFVESVCLEVGSGDGTALSRFPLVEALQAEHVRSSRERMLLAPVVRALLGHYPTREALIGRLAALHGERRSTDEAREGYWAANLIHLLAYLQGEVKSFDFSRCTVRGACLDRADFRRVDFSGAAFCDCIFKECFGQIISLACTRDGTRIAVGTAQGEILICNGHGSPLHRFAAHRHWVGALAFSPDGRRLASGGNDQTVRLWDAATGRHTKIYPERGCYVHAVCFSPDGQFMAFPGPGANVCVWNLEEDREAFCLQGHALFATSIDFHPQGRWLVSSGMDGCVLAWDLTTGHSRRLGCFEGAVSWDTKFSDDGRFLAVAGNEGLVRIWSWPSGELLHELPSGPGLVMTLRFVPETPLLAAAGMDGAIRLWDCITGKLRKCLVGHRTRVHDLIWLPQNGERQAPALASGGIDRELRFWDVGSGNCLRTSQGFSDGVWSLALTRDGQRLVSGHEDGTIRWWDTVSGEYLRGIKAHRACVWYIALSSREQWIATASDDCTEAAWDNANLREDFRWRCPGPYGRTVAFGMDDEFLATAGEGGSLCLWNTRTWQRQDRPTLHRAPIGTVASLAPGPGREEWAWITGSFDGSIQIAPHSNPASPRLLRGQGAAPHAIVHYPADGILAIGCSDGSIELWRLEAEGPHAILQGHTGPVEMLALHPTQPVIASGGIDKTIRIWNLESHACEGLYLGHDLDVPGLQFLPSGTSLLSGSADGTIRFWRYPEGICYRELRLPLPYEGMDIAGSTGLAPSRVKVLKMLGARGTPADY